MRASMCGASDRSVGIAMRLWYVVGYLNLFVCLHSDDDDLLPYDMSSDPASDQPQAPHYLRTCVTGVYVCVCTYVCVRV